MALECCVLTKSCQRTRLRYVPNVTIVWRPVLWPDVRPIRKVRTAEHADVHEISPVLQSRRTKQGKDGHPNRVKVPRIIWSEENHAADSIQVEDL